MSVDVRAIEAEWLTVCGRCDAGLPVSCSCPGGDPRPVISDLLTEVERLRGQNAELLLLLGWVEQARSLAHVRALLEEFRKIPDFPVRPPAARQATELDRKEARR